MKLHVNERGRVMCDLMFQPVMTGRSPTLECRRGLRMLALIGVHQQRKLPELLLDVLNGAVKSEIQLLVWIQLEGPEDSVHFIVAVHIPDVGEEFLQITRPT